MPSPDRSTFVYMNQIGFTSSAIKTAKQIGLLILFIFVFIDVSSTSSEMDDEEIQVQKLTSDFIKQNPQLMEPLKKNLLLKMGLDTRPEMKKVKRSTKGFDIPEPMMELYSEMTRSTGEDQDENEGQSPSYFYGDGSMMEWTSARSFYPKGKHACFDHFCARNRGPTSFYSAHFEMSEKIFGCIWLM